MQKLTRGKIVQFIQKYATEGRVLDVGAGNTEYSHLFPNRTTLDIDPTRKPDVVGDAEQLPFPNAHFDVVVCSEVLEHIKHPERAIKEMNRVLKQNGILVLTTRFAFPIHDAPNDYWRFTPYGLKLLFEEWEILETDIEADTFSTLAVLLQRIIFQTELHGGKVTKIILWIFALVFSKSEFLIKKQYGDIKRSIQIPTFLSSGVYLAARKTIV